MDAERWLPADGFPGYEVSDLGRIRRPDGSLARQWVTAKGYVRASLMRDRARPVGALTRESVMVKVHRVVATAFHGAPPDDHEVNHKNGVKGDNRAENLEWVTHAQNMRHAATTGLMRVGPRNPDGMSERTARMASEARDLRARGLSLSQVGAAFGVTKQRIHQLLSGVR